jgi:hypothetical protein
VEKEFRVTPSDVENQQFITSEGVTLNLKKFRFQYNKHLLAYTPLKVIETARRYFPDNCNTLTCANLTHQVQTTFIVVLLVNRIG